FGVPGGASELSRRRPGTIKNSAKGNLPARGIVRAFPPQVGFAPCGLEPMAAASPMRPARAGRPTGPRAHEAVAKQVRSSRSLFRLAEAGQSLHGQARKRL